MQASLKVTIIFFKSDFLSKTKISFFKMDTNFRK